MADKLYIGLGHKARQGKDTAARAIHCAYPSITRVIGFADALRAYCRVALGMREKNAKLLQLVGTEIFRDMNPRIWIEVLEATAQEADEPIILIPDCRFPDEADFVKASGGAVIDVQRWEAGVRFISPDRPADHRSEIGLDGYPFDYTIRSGDPEWTRTTAVQYFNRILDARCLGAHDPRRRTS